MTRKQKRKRIAHIRQEQKARKTLKKSYYGDLSLCVEWAQTYFKGKLPTKEQFEAMQRQGFLPTHGEGDGRRGGYI